MIGGVNCMEKNVYFLERDNFLLYEMFRDKTFRDRGHLVIGSLMTGRLVQ